MLRSDAKDSLRLRDKGISELNHTPHVTAVYASCSALLPPHATLATRRLARPYLDRTCTGRSRQLSWRLPFARPTSWVRSGRRRGFRNRLPWVHVVLEQLEAFPGRLDRIAAGLRHVERIFD